MNVLFICDEYPPGKNGGIGSAVQVLSRELVKQGHSVFVAGLYSYSYKEKNYEEDQGVKVWRMRYSLNLHVDSDSILYKVLERLPRFIQRYLNGKKAFNRYIDFISQLISSEKIDVIEIADFNNFAMHIGFVVKWPAFNVPLVLKSHGSYTYFCREMGMAPQDNYLQLDSDLYARANAFSCVSNYTATINKQIFNIGQAIKITYNGITIPTDAITHRKKQTVIFTGSLAYKKGIYSLMKAWNIINKNHPEAELIICGKGNTDKLIELLDENTKPSVTFMGHVDQKQVFSYLSQATLAVFPSYSETFGLGVVEAMSWHCPVIYTKRSCGPEIVRNEIEGLLIDPDNIAELAEAVIRLLALPDLRETLSKNAFESVKERFDVTVTAKINLQVYEEAIRDFKQKKL